MTIPQIDPLYWGGDDIGREAVIKKDDTFSLVIGLWRGIRRIGCFRLRIEK